MNKREAKHKYLDRWVGLRSEIDGMTIKNIKALNDKIDMLEAKR